VTDGAAAQERRVMVAEHMRARGISDERVLAAIERVPRHVFVPPEHRADAYKDHPVPIGYGQTISQPYIVAFMTEALRLEPQHRVLEIGTGCGYQTAILAELAADVYSIEVVEPLAVQARATLDELGYHNVHTRVGDGYAGWPEHAPFDRVIGAAAAEDVPPALVAQLAEGGILVLPVGVFHQELQVLRRHADRLETLDTLPVRFVPMVRGARR
jgi:protein-L-isoaspartate(D-aspartate) O-methyltransferase